MIEKKIDIDVNGKYKSFPHFFKATGYANADYTYTTAVQRMYDYLASYNGHPVYMRLHNIMSLHGKGDYYKVALGLDYGNPISNLATGVDIVLKRDESGKIVYDWTFVDKVYDIIIEHGMKPIVEMVYIPTAIQHSDWKCLPQSYKEYYNVVQEFVKHWTSRYGTEELRSWYFEILNEPENYPIMNERPETLFALYDYFEASVHSVDEKYQVGGPAVKQWEEGKRLFDLFLQHCNNGVNFVRGNFGTRIDFISVHCKGGEPTMVGPQMDYMFNTLREYSELLHKYPKFVNTPFFNDESDIVWHGNKGTEYASWMNFRNTEYAPGFVCKMVNTYCDVVQDELGLNLTIVDSDNSHLPWETYLFSGNRSQLTPVNKAPSSDIIRKAFFNAGVLLGRLGTERLKLNKSEDPEFGVKYGCLPTRFKDANGYAFMLWNFEDGLDGSVNTRTLKLCVKGLDNDTQYKVIKYRIDVSHSNPYGKWNEMGRPYPLNKVQIKALRENDFLEAENECNEIQGNFYEQEFTMPMHSVVLVIITKENKKEVLSIKKADIEMSALGERQVFLTWEFSKRTDFIGYRVYRNGQILNNKLLTSACYVDSEVLKGEDNSYQIEAIYAFGCSKSPSYNVKM